MGTEDDIPNAVGMQLDRDSQSSFILLISLEKHFFFFLSQTLYSRAELYLFLDRMACIKVLGRVN